MALMDVAMTVMSVFVYAVLGVGAVLFSIVLPVLICCVETVEAAEERAAQERRAALVARVEHALALSVEVEPMRRVAPVVAALVEVEPMRRVAPVVGAAPVVAKKKLGYFPYSAEGRSASENLVCAICLEVFEHGEECSEVPACQHLFHRDCLDVWMKTKTTCPLCRCDVVAGSERVSAAEDMV